MNVETIGEKAPRRPRKILIAVLLTAIVGVSAVAALWIYFAKEPIEPYWLTSTPEEQGMKSTKLNEMMESIGELGVVIDSVVVVRHGYIVLEEYPSSHYDRDRLHEIHSVTKSITSALIGIAIHEGFIDGVDQKVVDFFPERTIKNLDSRKRNMTLEHLLTMTSGFEWDEWTYPYWDNRNSWKAATSSNDVVQFVLDQPMVNDPGGEWVYNSGCSHLLSAIITKITGYSTLEFARKFLFEPLGISKVYWPRAPEGVYFGGGGIKLTSRSMAKFGYLYLNNGIWEGKHIVPAEWVTKSTETSFLNSEVSGYGFQWWTYPQSGVYYAAGLYGQEINIVPDLDMVVVFTAHTGYKGLNPEPWMLHRFIMAACNEYVPVQKYSKYGFSFDFPSWMAITEGGIWWQGTASEVSGMVAGGSFPEIFAVVWDTTESAPEHAAVLDEFFEGVAQQPGTSEVTGRGEFVHSLKDDHEMVFQYFNITDQRGLPGAGVIGDWYCDKAARIYIFVYLASPEIATQQDLLTEFQQYLDSFVCHG